MIIPDFVSPVIALPRFTCARQQEAQAVHYVLVAAPGPAGTNVNSREVKPPVTQCACPVFQPFGLNVEDESNARPFTLNPIQGSSVFLASFRRFHLAAIHIRSLREPEQARMLHYHPMGRLRNKRLCLLTDRCTGLFLLGRNRLRSLSGD